MIIWSSLYYTILYYTILYYTILYYTILYYTILYYTILYYTILYYTILYYTILYCTILYYIILYYIVLGTPSLHSRGYWRDLLAFTWNFRTMEGFAARLVRGEVGPLKSRLKCPGFSFAYLPYC